MGRFGNTHLIAIIFLIGVLSSFIGVQLEDVDQIRNAKNNPIATEIQNTQINVVNNPPNQQTSINELQPSPQLRNEKAPENNELNSLTTQIRPGENLESIFVKNNIPRKELQNIIDSGPLGSRLDKVFPGHEVSFFKDEVGRLVKLIYSPGPLESIEFKRTGNRYRSRTITKEPKETVAHSHGVINHSLFMASQRAGLDDEITMRLAQIFQWDIDFVLDIRSGDEFFVLYKEQYLGDEMIGFGEIMAAEFINQGEHYRAVRFVDSSGKASFYTPDGRSMKKAFLRAPVNFSRISSNFNLKRLHPIHRQNMPHRGIDYAAPRGTPVVASGDGRISTASRSNANGNYVVIKHGETFETKYLHLNKFHRSIRKGTKVSQGQTIGYVGSTGWATGPHLHYEFLVNGIHKNPRTVDLPKAEPIPRDQLDYFRASVGPTLELLATKKLKNQRENQMAASG